MMLKICLVLVVVTTVCSAASVKRQLTGCYYKGVTHQQGETWQDGCQYDCTCVDASVGKYNCNTVCLNWNLPPECHLVTAAPGMCCPTPSCPPGWQVNTPTGYVPR